MTQVKVFTTHDHLHNMRHTLNKDNKKITQKNNLTIKIEKNDGFTPFISHFNSTANKVRESKECHNITQLNNESTKNKNRKKFIFKEIETSNHSLIDSKNFPKTTKHQDMNNTQKAALSLFFKASNNKNPNKTKPASDSNNQVFNNNNNMINNNNTNKNVNVMNSLNKHERIKSLDFNSKSRLMKSEDGDLLKKLHYQKIDLMNNEDVIFRIKEVLDSNNNNNKNKGSKKKFLDADIAYFKK